jgi:hypothetical protein
MHRYEDYHITNENRNFKIILLCLLPFYDVIWNYFLGKFNRQQKKVFYIQKKIIRKWQALKGESHVGNCLRNLILFH